MDWLQVAVLLVISPFFLFPSMERTWIFMVILLLWLGPGIAKKRLFERTLLDWAILLLLIQVLMTCLIVPDLGISLPKVAGVIYGIAVFYSLVALLNSEKRLKAAVASFLGGGLAFSMIGLLGMQPFQAKYLDPLIVLKSKIPFLDFRLPGAEEGFHPNAVGGTLILILPLFVTSVYQYFGTGKNNRIVNNKLFLVFSCVGLFVLGSMLLLTRSRGSLLGLTISGWLFIMQFISKKKTIIIASFLFVVLALFLIGAFYIMLAENDKYAARTLEISDKALGRTSLWAVGLETIKKHPLTGIGMNRIRLLPEVGFKRAQVHNHFIHTAAELGIPALIALIAILIGAGVMCVIIWRKTNHYWIKMTTVGLAWGQVAHLLFGLTDSIPLGAKTGIFFWVSLALIVSTFNIVNSPNRSAC